MLFPIRRAKSLLSPMAALMLVAGASACSGDGAPQFEDEAAAQSALDDVVPGVFAVLDTAVEKFHGSDVHELDCPAGGTISLTPTGQATLSDCAISATITVRGNLDVMATYSEPCTTFTASGSLDISTAGTSFRLPIEAATIQVCGATGPYCYTAQIVTDLGSASLGSSDPQCAAMNPPLDDGDTEPPGDTDEPPGDTDDPPGDTDDMDDMDTDPFSLTTTSLAVGRRNHCAVAADGKLVVVGGVTGSGTGSLPSLVEIYDPSTGSWSTLTPTPESLTQRESAGCAAVGNLVFVAGGFNLSLGGQLDTVTVIDIEAQTVSDAGWTLPTAVSSPSGVSCGNKVIIAGGQTFDVITEDQVVIYDTAAGSDPLSTATLSEPGIRMAVASANGKAIFVGGNNASDIRDNVDIYDCGTETWSSVTLTWQQTDMAAVSLGTEIYIAGGSYTGVGVVRETYVFDTDTDTLMGLDSESSGYLMGATALGSFALFAGGYNANAEVRAYDTATSTWSMFTLSEGRADPRAISIGNQAFVVGGDNVPPGQPYGASSVVDIITLPE